MADNKNPTKNQRQRSIEAAFKKTPGDIADDVDPISDKLNQIKNKQREKPDSESKNDKSRKPYHILCVGNMDKRVTPTSTKHLSIREDYLEWLKLNTEGICNETLLVNAALRKYIEYLSTELESNDVTVFNIK